MTIKFWQAMVLTVFISAITSYVVADIIEREINEEDIKECSEVSTIAFNIQSYRFYEKTKQADFWYKHGHLFESYEVDRVDRIMRHLYEYTPANTHPASVKEHFKAKCLNYRFRMKPEFEYRI